MIGIFNFPSPPLHLVTERDQTRKPHKYVDTVNAILTFRREMDCIGEMKYYNEDNLQKYEVMFRLRINYTMSSFVHIISSPKYLVYFRVETVNVTLIVCSKIECNEPAHNNDNVL